MTIQSLDLRQTSTLKQSLAYWLPTALLAFLMGTGGVVDAFQLAGAAEIVGHLGYPAYFCSLLGVAKLLGTLAILTPNVRTLREWAYAGFTFDVIAATLSVAVVDHTSSVMMPAVLACIYFSRRGALARDARRTYA